MKIKSKYALYIGRWQTPYLHNGHLWCFEESWKENKPVLIAIRDVDVDKDNPYEPKWIKKNIEKQLKDKIKQGLCKVIIIPDIECVRYGRGVGYRVEELNPPDDIAKISATKIREENL